MALFEVLEMIRKHFRQLIAVAGVFAIILVAIGCDDPNGSERVLRQSGYTNIKAGGYRYIYNGNDDYVTEFSATSPNGEKVTGVVTYSWGKGRTIRLD